MLKDLIERASLTTLVVCPYRSGVFQVPSQQTINRRLAGFVTPVEDMPFALLRLGTNNAQMRGRVHFFGNGGWGFWRDPSRRRRSSSIARPSYRLRPSRARRRTQVLAHQPRASVLLRRMFVGYERVSPVDPISAGTGQCGHQSVGVQTFGIKA